MTRLYLTHNPIEGRKKAKTIKKVGLKVIKQILTLAEKLKDFEGREYFESENPINLKLWLFAHNGVTKEAKKLLKQHNIYWSTRSDLDALIKLMGLRALPPINDT